MTVAITLAFVVFALAALADGRGLRLLRWALTLSATRTAPRTSMVASPSLPSIDNRAGVGNATAAGAPATRSDANARAYAPVRLEHSDTRDLELTRR